MLLYRGIKNYNYTSTTITSYILFKLTFYKRFYYTK